MVFQENLHKLESAEQTERKGKRLGKSTVEIIGFVEARLGTVYLVIQRKVFTRSEAVIVNKKLKFSQDLPLPIHFGFHTHVCKSMKWAHNRK